GSRSRPLAFRAKKGAPMIATFAATHLPAPADLEPRSMHQAPLAHRAPGADPYQWLQNRDSPEVLAYLEAENAYTEACLADQAELRRRLFEEIRGRIRETDLSLPTPWKDWLYYQRTTAGDEYPRSEERRVGKELRAS